MPKLITLTFKTVHIKSNQIRQHFSSTIQQYPLAIVTSTNRNKIIHITTFIEDDSFIFKYVRHL